MKKYKELSGELNIAKRMLFLILPQRIQCWRLIKESKMSHRFLERSEGTTPEGSAIYFKNTSLLSNQIVHMNNKIRELLIWEDKNSMAFSIETRLPFMDYRFVRFALGLPDGYKISNGVAKRILRDAMKGSVPEVILDRHDKIGFSTPERQWLASDEMRGKVDEMLSSEAFGERGYVNVEEIRGIWSRIEHADELELRALWRSIALETWFKIFIDEGDDPKQVISFDEGIVRSLRRNERWIRENRWTGWDPYDGFESPKMRKFKSTRWLGGMVQQIMRFNPFNLRDMLGIPKMRNSKSLALFAMAYLNMWTIWRKRQYLRNANWLLSMLEKQSVPGFSGMCWGYPFDWYSQSFHLPANRPNVAATCFAIKAFLMKYRLENEERYLRMAGLGCEFMLKDLDRTLEKEGNLCLSYTPYDKTRVFNVNSMAAGVLADTGLLTDNIEMVGTSKKIVRYVLENQRPNGAWYYGYDEDGKLMNLIDFHQGFLLDGLFEYVRATNDQKTMGAVSKGLEYYRKEQFLDDGRARWRGAQMYPIDIHNQAQGIITFSNLSGLSDDNLRFAETIARWTITNMQDPDGHFHYLKYRLFSNKIPYMRWSQAWMMYALTNLLLKNRDMAILEMQKNGGG